MVDHGNDTFIKVTNKDIFRKMEDFEKSTMKRFDDMTQRQDRTNGKVKLSSWIGTTALTITLLALGFLLEHMSKK